MMKRLVLFITLLLVPVFVLGQQQIESFDTQLDSSYWRYENSANADPTKSFIIQTVNTEEKVEGVGSLQLEWGAHNIESWGGYTKIERVAPGAEVWDWSAYDSISFWYNNTVAQDLPSRVTMRFELYEISNAPDTTSSASATEFYYSFQAVLDDAPGWHEWKMPLTDDPNAWNGEQFNRTGWAGIAGNNQLDPDRIKGYSIEFSIGGSGDGDFATGTILIDDISLKGFSGKNLILFNGKAASPKLEQFTWGGASMGVAEGEGANEGTNALLWTHGETWSGAGWNMPSIDLTKEWLTDSISFKMKTDPGVSTLRFQFEDGAGVVGINFDPNDDGEWHDYKLALADFVFFDNTEAIDTTALKVFQMLPEGNGVTGNRVWIDDFWTGSPTIDVTAPAAPQSLTIYTEIEPNANLVTWLDVPGETGEVYNVYASLEPITDVNAEGVESVAVNVSEEEQRAYHYLRYPQQDKEVSYYYAVTCMDNFSNVGPAGVTAGATTNTALGVPSIAMTPPASFVADGDLLEWYEAGILPFEFTATISHTAGGTFDDEDDMSAIGFVAMDDDNLYLAFDVVDNVWSFNEGGDFWQDDMIEVYIGLYNQTTKHVGFVRGEEPDYKFIMLGDRLFTEQFGSIDDPIYFNDSPNYEYVDWGGGAWSVEAVIPFDSLIQGNASGDKRFEPARGMKIPLDIAFHDTDETVNTREGIMSFSPYNNDNSYLGAENWFYTWVGDTNQVVSAVNERTNYVINTFELDQNYPNPFNPETTIQFNLPKASDVTLTIYSTTGQVVKTLVSQKLAAGQHRMIWNGSDESGHRVASGVYIYKLQSGKFSTSRKLLLVK